MPSCVCYTFQATKQYADDYILLLLAVCFDDKNIWQTFSFSIGTCAVELSIVVGLIRTRIAGAVRLRAAKESQRASPTQPGSRVSTSTGSGSSTTTNPAQALGEDEEPMRCDISGKDKRKKNPVC